VNTFDWTIIGIIIGICTALILWIIWSGVEIVGPNYVIVEEPTESDYDFVHFPKNQEDDLE